MAAKAVIFDAGGVLTSSVTDCVLALERVLGLPEHSLLPVFREPSPNGHEADLSRLERGEMTEVEFWRRLPAVLEARLGVRVDVPSDVEVLRRALWGGLSPNDRMLAVAQAIGRTYKTALLTNGVREWDHWWDLCRADVFDVVVNSCDVGLRKPEAAIYELTCARLDVRPQEAVFLDDIPANVDAARALGMVGIVFQTTDQAIAELKRYFPGAF